MKNRYTETPLFHIAASAGIVIFAILVGGAAASKIANTGTSSNTVSVSSAAQETTRASSVAAVVDDGERLYELASAYESTGDYAKAFPNCELKYSFNNTDYQDIPKCFDTVVVGKRYLRSKEMRHQLLESGYNLVLLLNNGCSFTCPGPCRNGTECRKIVAQQLLTSTPSELYALESFFPEELTRLLETDSCSDQYRFTVDSFLKFADFFFDGLFADWAVLDHINQAQSRVENTKGQIKRVLALLKKMREDVDVQIADEKEKQEQLAVETEL